MIISFSTRPSRGGEGGVGWAFVRAASERARRHGKRVTVIFDARDALDVQKAICDAGTASFARLEPVAVPAAILHRVGDRRTRLSYLAWTDQARKALANIVRCENVSVVHQVTFATTSMPPVHSGLQGAFTVWGPTTVPSAVPNGVQVRSRSLQNLAIPVGQFFAVRHARRVDRIIANNDRSASFLRRRDLEVDVEPNIVVEPIENVTEYEDDLLITTGHLIPKKQPWLAIQAMSDKRLRHYRLTLIGDGPLRKQLQNLTFSEGLQHRVAFAGQVTRKEAMAHAARARALVHPSYTEGSPWAVGEAAAMGLASVVFEGSGADTTARMSANDSIVCKTISASALADGIVNCLRHDRPAPSSRWSSSRLPVLLDRWWQW